MSRAQTKTGGRVETSGVIPGDYALSVGNPKQVAPKGWQWTKLTKIARLESGHTPSRKHPEYWGGDIPWVGIKDATSNHGGTLLNTIQHTNELGISNSSARILPKDTVCLSRTASVGYVVVMGQDMATSQDFVNWVCNPVKLDFQFLKYILLSEKRSFLRFASGTTHQTIYFPEVKAFHICIPCLTEQKSISNILGTLDDKIELNRQMNQTLEAMAQALFKSWFVDFDPVIDNALAAGNSIPDALKERAATRQALGDKRKPLPEDIRELFPSAFEYSEELGWIPEGWNAPMFKEFTTEVKTKVGKRDVPEYSSTNNGLIPRAKTFKKQLSKDKSKNKLIGYGDIVFGMSRQVLNFGVMHNQIGSVSSAYQVFNVDDSVIYPKFVEQYMRLREHIYFNMLGSSSREGQSLSKSSFLVTKILTPPERIQQSFHKTTRFVDKIKSTSVEIETLTTLRDTLLPKLLSGELRIPDAEKLIEETV